MWDQVRKPRRLHAVHRDIALLVSALKAGDAAAAVSSLETQFARKRHRLHDLVKEGNAFVVSAPCRIGPVRLENGDCRGPADRHPPVTTARGISCTSGRSRRGTARFARPLVRRRRAAAGPRAASIAAVAG